MRKPARKTLGPFALKLRLLEIHRTGGPHRALRRATAAATAATAVTLVAGMSVAPANAALPDPATDTQPQIIAQPDGIRVAQVVEPDPFERDPFEPDPFGRAPLDYSSRYGPYGAIPPDQQARGPRGTRPPLGSGPLDPGTARQLRDAEDVPKILERADELEKHQQELQQEGLEEPDQHESLKPVPGLPHDPALDQAFQDLAEQDKAIRDAALAERQPPGYLNELRVGRDLRFEYPDLAEDNDKHALRDELARSFLFNEMFTDEEREQTLGEFDSLIGSYHGAWTTKGQEMAKSLYNEAVDEFNRSELEARDMYDGHPATGREMPRPPLPERRPADIPAEVEDVPDDPPAETQETPNDAEPEDTPTTDEPDAGTPPADAQDNGLTDNPADTQTAPESQAVPDDQGATTDDQPGTGPSTDNADSEATTSEPGAESSSSNGTTTDSSPSSTSSTESSTSDTSSSSDTSSESDSESSPSPSPSTSDSSPGSRSDPGGSDAATGDSAGGIGGDSASGSSDSFGGSSAGDSSGASSGDSGSGSSGDSGGDGGF
jgi:hypothetical protein